MGPAFNHAAAMRLLRPPTRPNRVTILPGVERVIQSIRTGIRRFCLLDPFGKLINILSHT